MNYGLAMLKSLNITVVAHPEETLVAGVIVE